MHPRLQIVVPEKLVAVQFGDAVTICAQGQYDSGCAVTGTHMCTENEYMDRLELKSSTDRTLGVGVMENEPSILVLTAATMMKTTMDMDEVAAFHPE